MFDASRLVRYGYFPKELPPCFTTKDLSDHIADVIRALSCFNPQYSIPLTYSGFKSEISRRQFAIPNPYYFCKAVDVIVRRESEIKPHFSKSKNSLRAPIEKKPKDDESYAVRSSSMADTRNLVEKLYQNNRFELLLDISSFFGSIYTHSIPWAIHGINTAKKDSSNALVGNELDSCMRAMNYRQTNGILIGNDISRIISEIVLCAVDEKIQKRFPKVGFCRFVDDYFFYTEDGSEIHQIIAAVRNELAVYQLNLNESKVHINESPFLFGKAWYADMMQAINLNSNDFLSWMIDKYNRTRDPALLKYGLKVIDARKFSPSNQWDTIQSRILNIWVRYPFLAEPILPLLWNNRKQLKKSTLKTAINSVIDQSIILQQDLELVWAIWFIKVFDIQISQQTAVRILRSGNDLAIIILLDVLSSRKMTSKQIIHEELKSLCAELKEVDCDDEGKCGRLAYSSRWLLSYEAERENHFDSTGETFEFFRKDDFFKKLIRYNIKFYDSSFMYSDNHFERKRKKGSRRIDDAKRIIELLSSSQQSNGRMQDSQQLPEHVARLIEQLFTEY